MSIKRYLFLLITGIVLGVAAIQLLLISLFKQHLNDEIVAKSQQLSTIILDVALDVIDSEAQEFVILSSKQDTSGKVNTKTSLRMIKTADGKPGCVLSESVNTHDKNNQPLLDRITARDVQCEQNLTKLAMADVSSLAADAEVHGVIGLKGHVDPEVTEQLVQLKQNKLMMKRWSNKLHEIIVQKHQDERVVRPLTHVIKTLDSINVDQHVIHNPATASSTAIEDFVNYMIYLILACTLVALFLALWLSDHFTRPLQQLASGFSALQEGQLGVVVKPSGINEYRKTIEAFNQMSQRLAQLAEAEKTLQQQGHLAELGEVSRGLAHALRNPMHTIGLSVEQLKDADLPDKLKTKLQDKIQAKIKHIDKTIKALLTLSSADIERDEQVPLRLVIQDVILELKANDSNVNISLEAPKGKAMMQGAESEIRAIIHTLVVNAVEASEPDTQVMVSIVEQTDNVQVRVRDQGNGISAQVSDKLFQPHISSKAEGAGMGLYISNRLATLYYNGKITLVDNPGPGCTATVTLGKGKLDITKMNEQANK